MFSYIISGVLILVISLYYYVTRTFNYWTSRNVAGPKPLPLFGNIMESALRKKNIALVMHKIYLDYPKEKLVGVYRMTTPCVLVRDLEVIKHVMIKDFDMFEDRGIEFSKEGYGANLFHSDGETWRALRNRFTPIFTSRKLKNMLYLMTDRGDKFVQGVEKIVKEQPEQAVLKHIQLYTIATISACAFGIDIDKLGKTLDSLYKLDEMALNTNFFSELDMMFPGILKHMTYTIYPALAREIFDGLIKNVITERNGKPSNRNDFIDLILALKEKGEIEASKINTDDKIKPLELTESVMAAQAFIFFLGGYETSSTTMTYMMYQLALNPDIQNKMIEEIDEVLERCNGDVTYETLNELTYMEKVFDETLRMYPIVDPLQRNAKNDYKVPGTDVVIKKGQTVLVSPRSLHYDEQYYPEPHKFDPERFSPEAVGERHSCAYIPFGVGPRNCIGMRFAKVQSRVCLLKFFSKFRVEATKQTPKVIEYDPRRTTVSPVGGIPLNIIRRK
ncbi:PREDICTED: cytochrome P450 6B2-like [Papilio xuthus]|uniref:unspecific monooxygenase n=2 Tax=Papilio xuthus TaxID=66420 RepID=A0AAJ6ZK32_PAPXU|nr:PREDICTED: cytochrome P450 6B2-like [Papilio xuthus]